VARRDQAAACPAEGGGCARLAGVRLRVQDYASTFAPTASTRPSGCISGLGDAVGGPLERGDVDAFHLHHRVERPPCPGGIGITDQPDKLARNDLPRHAEAVFHSAALLSLGHRREYIGKAIGFGLGLYR
jgi:hypothetical protein